jgi:uncharacterized membrane protein
VTVAELLRLALTLAAALGCGLVAGVFFAFSAFVMRALTRLPPEAGIAAMQSINVVVLGSWFMVAFLGTAAVCTAALVVAVLRWREPGAVQLLAGAVLYLGGSLLVTIRFNVPRNEALAAVSPGDPEAARLWAGYLAGWTAWNHVRTVAALGAAASFGMALAR